MNNTVTFRHMDKTDALKEYAESKCEKLSRYLVEPIEIHWVLSVERIRQIADLTVSAKDVNIKGHDEEEDMYAAIDLVAAKVEAQLRKHKEKVKNHKHGVTPASEIALDAEEA